jgi:FMN phosphatase YigB (HAD superfamily)
MFSNNDNVFNYMIERCLEKCSSYNKIFEESYDLYKYSLKEEIGKEEFIHLSLKIYRNYIPLMELSLRTKVILQAIKIKYKTVFLVTDGNPILQRKKFESLKLGQFFQPGNVIYTGDYTKDYEKPSIKSISFFDLPFDKAVFFGDRENDREFANRLGMGFVKVLNMVEVN